MEKLKEWYDRYKQLRNLDMHMLNTLLGTAFIIGCAIIGALCASA